MTANHKLDYKNSGAKDSMKTNSILNAACLAGLFAGAFVSVCSADIVYKDNFDRVGDLNGSAPSVDNTSAGATWTATGGYVCTGTNGLVNNTANGDWQGGAHLPLDWEAAYPDPKVQVDVFVTGNFFSLTLGDCGYWGGGASALLKLWGNGDADVCEGPGWDGTFVKFHVPGAGTAGGWNRLRIDYSNSVGTATFYVNGGIVAADVPVTTHTTGVGFNSDTGGNTLFTNFLVTVGSEVVVAPSIATQPLPKQTVFVGDPVQLSVQCSGSLPMYYQWRTNGTDIPAATQRTYTIPAGAVSDTANYTVVITNEAPTANVKTSEVARVEVHLEAQSTLAEANFDNLNTRAWDFQFTYASDNTLNLPSTAGPSSAGGQDGSGSFLITADGTDFANGTPSWSGFGGGFGLASASLPVTNLNFYEAFASVRIDNLQETKTNTPGRIALRFFAPDGTTGVTNGERDYIFSVVKSFTLTSNYQAFAFLLSSGTPSQSPNGLDEFALYRANINAVQFEFSSDNNTFYTDFVNGPGDAMVVDNAKLVLRQSPAVSATWNGTHTLVEWADLNVELLAATSAAGPYNPVLGATSPYQVPAGSPHQFFRTRFAVAP